MSEGNTWRNHQRRLLSLVAYGGIAVLTLALALCAWPSGTRQTQATTSTTTSTTAVAKTRYVERRPPMELDGYFVNDFSSPYTMTERICMGGSYLRTTLPSGDVMRSPNTDTVVKACTHAGMSMPPLTAEAAEVLEQTLVLNGVVFSDEVGKVELLTPLDYRPHQ